MTSWLWRWVESQLRANVPATHQATTLGDLMEDHDRRQRRSGALVAAVWLIHECRDVSRVYRTGHFPTHTRSRRMPNWQLPEARHALRRLRRQPAASLAAIVTLGTAFAAALATWILIDSVLLTPVPAAVNPDRLVVVRERNVNRDGTPGRLSQHMLFSRVVPLRESGIFTAVAAIGRNPALVGDPARPVSRDVAFVTANFFQALGVPVLRGRGILADDDHEGAPVVAIITHRFWQTEFLEDPSVLGKVIRVGNTTATIVGIAPAGFRGINLTDTPVMFVPVHTAYDVLGRGMDYLHVGLPRTSPVSFFTIVGRLPETRPYEQAAAALGALPAERRGAFEALPLALAALPEAARPNLERFTQLLATTVGLLLLIGILSVGLLALIRSEARREELALCLALGASKGRLMRGVMAESAWLSLGGLAVAIPLTLALLAGARSYELPGRISIAGLAFTVDTGVVLLAVAIVVVTALVIGVMATGLGLSGAVGDVLRARSGATTRLSRRRTRQALIVAQVAVALVLLAGTGLFARSVSAALGLNAAFAPDQVLTTNLSVRGLGYGPAEADRYFRQVRDEVAALPGVDAVAGRASAGGMSAGGTVTFNGERREVPSFLGYVHVDERYFDTVGLRILSGRDFSATDVEGAEPVGIVSESLARFIARGGDAVGMTITESSRRLDRPGPDVVRIIGVVPDLVTNVNALEPLALYYTVRQKPGSESQGLHVRSRRPTADLAGDIRRVVERIDGRVAPSEFLTMRDLIARQMAPQQFGAAVLGALASVALLLTLLGTYVIAETMAKARERELGVRAALGATGRHLGGLILTESAVLIGLGLAGGLGLTWLAASTVEALLYQTEPFDLPAIGGATVAILALGLLVSARPALRAARVDIAALLRD